jgi:hypothetical protein
MLIALEMVAWLPFLYGTYLAIRKGKDVRGRWLFVLVSPILTFSLLVVLPLMLWSVFAPLAIFVAPAFKQILQHAPWWSPIADVWVRYWWLSFIPIAVVYVVLATWSAHKLWKRWPRVFDALVSDPSKNSKPTAHTATIRDRS